MCQSGNGQDKNNSLVDYSMLRPGWEAASFAFCILILYTD